MEFNIALFQECDAKGNPTGWVGQCLEYDFSGASDSEEKAMENLMLGLRAEVAFAEKDGRKPFEGLPKTSDKFLDWWKARDPRGPIQWSSPIQDPSWTVKLYIG